MTETDIEVALIARLLDQRACQEAARLGMLIRRYENAGWLRQGNRRGQWIMREEAADQLQARLGQLLPSWDEDFALLRAHARDPMDPKSIACLPALRRQARAGGLVNRRNWNAVAGLGPKRQSVFATEAILTKDWIMRLRPNQGLTACWEAWETDLAVMAQTWTECLIPQRLWMGLRNLGGNHPRCVITCENLGAYIDLPLAPDMMAVYAPGRDTEPAVHLLSELPDTPWLHFGDLDPEGVVIAEQIAHASDRKVSMYIPTFAMEYLDLAQKKGVEWGNVPDHPVFAVLKHQGLGIFQEVFMLDPRLKEDLSQYVVPQDRSRNQQ